MPHIGFLEDQMLDRNHAVAEMRRFNRFYTRKLGLLTHTLSRSDYTLTEARVLFEIGHASHVSKTDGLSATDIAEELNLDAAYLARILKGFVAKKLVAVRPDVSDRRRRILNLTSAGEAALADLQATANRELLGLLKGLSDAQLSALNASQRRIAELLGPGSADIAEVQLRAHRPGDIGWVVSRQAQLYAEEYGWDEQYEALACEICAKFLRDFVPGQEFCWVAERAGERLGAVFLVRRSDDEAQLRLLHVEAAARGMGVGTKLVEACVAMARQVGYRKLVLWTNDVLHAARRVYERAGFVMVSQDAHHSFGKDLHGQMWELDLSRR